MPLQYRILSVALDELHDAAAYVEQERSGFGIKLLDEFETLVDYILERPSSGTPVTLDVPVYEFHRFQMRRFRYAIFTARRDNELIVFAISHHKRAPGYWARRLNEL